MVQGRLAGLTSEFNSTAQSANRLLGSLMNRGKGTTSSPEALEAVVQIAPEPLPSTKNSSRRSDLPPSLQKRSDLPPSMQKAREQQQELPAAAAQATASSQAPAKNPRAALDMPQQSRGTTERPKAVRQKLSRKAVDTPEATPATAQGRHHYCAPLC